MSRRQRVYALVGAVVVAAVVVVLVVVLTGGSSNKTTTSTAAVTTPSTSFLDGVPQSGDTLGNPNASATMYVFEDPQCPYCREWSLDTLPTVVQDYVKTGRVKLVWRGIAIIGPNSVNGLRAAYAAGAQNKLWNMVDALYTNQGEENSGWITSAAIRAIAPTAGVDATKLLAGVNAAAVTKALVASANLAKADKVAGTPTFVVVQPPGKPAQLNESGLDPASFTEALSAALQ